MGNSLISKKETPLPYQVTKKCGTCWTIFCTNKTLKTIHVLYIHESFPNFETSSGNMNQHNENSITIKLTVGI